MQWMLGLFTKARLTQRSLFKSIYNILKVIFSLNKRLRDTTLFSLLVFFVCFCFCFCFKWRNTILCNSDPRLELCIWSCCLWAWWGVPPGKVTGQEHPVPGRMGLVRCQNQGAVVVQVRSRPQNRLTAGHVMSHTPHAGTIPFSVCPSSYLYTLPHFVIRVHDTQTDPERKLHVFSDDGYVFIVIANWRI